jgi:hypothetical protein
MSGLLSIVTGSASAEPWSIQPLVGASAGYDTNPALHQFDPASEQHLAALFNIPLRYDGDGIGFLLTPSGRISNSPGFASLASNYFHLDTSLQLTDELDSTTIQGELARDSSLVQAGGFVNGVGVRRDSGLAVVDWTRFITQRSQVQLDASWSRVDYNQPANETPLVDYQYLSAGPTFAYASSELNTLKLLSAYGQYQSQNGITESKSVNLQLGFVRQLNELWSLSATGGYSHSTNTEKEYFGPFFLGRVSSDQNGSVYALTLTRKSEQFSLSGSLSHSLQPTGFAYLSLQDSISLNATYASSERWDYALSGAWQKIHDPFLGGGESNVRYLNTKITANWHWTERWIVSLHAIRVAEQISPPLSSAASSGVSVDVSRQFLRHDL